MKPRRRSNAVSVIAETVMTLALLVILFLVYELWWTGIGAETDRQESVESFYSQFDGAATEPAVDTCYTLDDGTEIGCAPTMRELTGPEDIMGTLYAPRLGEDWIAPVRAGVSSYQLDRGGVGHYLTTDYPDEPGNFAVAGHRNTYSSMLGDQDMLVTGDKLYLLSADGLWTYEVTQRKVITPWDTSVLNADPNLENGVEPETGTLTLTTCHPMFSNTERLVHHATITDFTPLGGDAPEELSHHQDLVEVFDGSAIEEANA